MFALVLYPVRLLSAHARVAARRLRHGYLFRNAAERRRNRALLAKARAARAAQPDPAVPLVSVVIATYNRAHLLTTRSIPSALSQTHPNVEVIVVGDCCIDDTADRVAALNDPRVRFVNLAERGRYPQARMDRWLVAGVTPMNAAIEMAAGQWIAPLDDDDAFTPDHVEVLLRNAQQRDLEMVYGIVRMEQEDGSWTELGSEPLRLGHISRMAVLYHKSLSFIRNDIESWKYAEPADWNLWRRMREAGVRIGFVPHVVGSHFRERTQAVA